MKARSSPAKTSPDRKRHPTRAPTPPTNQATAKPARRPARAKRPTAKLATSGKDKGPGTNTTKSGDKSAGDGQPKNGEKQSADGDKSEKFTEKANPQNSKSNQKKSEQKNDGREGDGQGGDAAGAGTGPRDKDNPKPRENDPPEAPREDEPNVDHARRATDLALDHLRDRMQKGQDQEILKKLGWSRDEADEFLRRWADLKRKANQSGADGAEGRKQLDDALKTLGLRQSRAAARTTTAEKDATARPLLRPARPRASRIRRPSQSV